MEIEVRLMNHFLKNGKMVPDFISGRFATHKNAFFTANVIFQRLGTLFRPNVISQRAIDELFIEFCEILEEIMEQDELLSLDYARYFKEMISIYMENAIEEEAFEVAENLKNFYVLMETLKL